MNYLNCIAFHPLFDVWIDTPPVITEQTPNHDSAFQLSEIVFSIETSELTLRISRDGFVFLHSPINEPRGSSDTAEPIDRILSNWNAYLQLLNCFWLLWDAEVTSNQQLDVFTLYELTIREVLRVSCNERGGIAHSSLPPQSRASEFMRRRWSRDAKTLLVPMIQAHPVISRESCERAARKFMFAIKDKHLTIALSSIAKSVSEFKNADYSASAVLAWFVVESVISSIWSDFLEKTNSTREGDAPRISKKRREKLTGRDFTMSIICEALELSDVIETDLLRDIDVARSLRNRVVHQQCRPSNEECRHCILVATKVVKFKWNFEFVPNLGYWAPGL